MKREFSNQTKLLFYFLGHQGLNIIHYIVFLSIATFFHFLLNHRLADINDWVFDKSWGILGFCRFFSTYFMFKLLSIRLKERNPLKNILFQLKSPFRTEILIMIFFLFSSFLILGHPKTTPDEDFGVSKTLISYFVSSGMIFSDLLILLVLATLYPLSEKKWQLVSLVTSFFATVTIVILFRSSFSEGLFLFFSFLMAYSLLKYRGILGYNHSLLFCLLFFSPMVAFFGLDPLWNKTYSFLPMTNPLGEIELSILGIVALSYLIFKTKAI